MVTARYRGAADILNSDRVREFTLRTFTPDERKGPNVYQDRTPD